MLWQQGAVCFLVWIAYGVWLRRRSDSLRASLGAWSRPAKVAMASVGFLASIAILFGGLAAIDAAGGLQDGRLTIWAWITTAVLGLGFVHVQVLAAGAMVTIVQDQEAARKAGASNNRTAGKE